MELLTNVEQQGENSNETPVIYTACGWVAGVFQPQKERKKKLYGMLLTQDGQEIPALLDWHLLRRIKKKIGDRAHVAEFLQSPHQWKTYPRTQPLRFDIMKIAELPCQEQKPAKKNPKNSRPIELDKFRVVGQIRYIADDKVVMRIECNEQVPNRRANNHPLYLKLAGSIPTGEVGQIWELEVWRCGTKLTISKAKVYQPSEDDIKLYKLLFEQKMASQTTQEDAPEREQLPRYDKVSPRSAPESSSAGHQDLQQSKTKPTGCEETDLTKTPKAQTRRKAILSKGDGDGRNKNKSVPSIAGNTEVPEQQHQSRNKSPSQRSKLSLDKAVSP